MGSSVRYAIAAVCLMVLPAAAQFESKSSASQLQDAIRGSASERSSKVETPEAISGVTVLTDTKGFVLKPYIDHLHSAVRGSWYGVIREKLANPNRRNGKVIVAFSISRNGEVHNIKVAESSGEPDLDAIAVEGLRNSSPLQPLPKALPNEELSLRFTFRYLSFKRSRWGGR